VVPAKIEKKLESTRELAKSKIANLPEKLKEEIYGNEPGIITLSQFHRRQIKKEYLENQSNLMVDENENYVNTKFNNVNVGDYAETEAKNEEDAPSFYTARDEESAQPHLLDANGRDLKDFLPKQLAEYSPFFLLGFWD
jgi:hypothetical protein